MNNQVIDDQLTAFNMEDDIVKCCDPTVVGCLTSRKRNNVLPIKTRRKRVRSVAKAPPKTNQSQVHRAQRPSLSAVSKRRAKLPIKINFRLQIIKLQQEQIKLLKTSVVGLEQVLQMYRNAMIMLVESFARP